MSSIRNRRASVRGKGSWVLPAAPRPATLFVQHAFQTQVTLLSRLPRIYIMPQAYEDMFHLVDLAEGEVGWLGTVKVLGPGRYLIEEIFLLHQQVSAVRTDLSKEGKSKLVKKLLSEKGGVEKLDRLGFWGHSHGDMATTPSQIDEQQIEKFDQDGCPFMIMGIFNKRGRAEFTFFDFEAGVRIDDVPWQKYEKMSQERRDLIVAEMDEKLTQTEATFIDYMDTGEQPPFFFQMTGSVSGATFDTRGYSREGQINA